MNTPTNQALTGGKIVLQWAVVQSHQATLRTHPELAQHPAFQRYLRRLTTTIPRLAERLGQLDHPAYQLQ